MTTTSTTFVAVGGCMQEITRRLGYWRTCRFGDWDDADGLETLGVSGGARNGAERSFICTGRLDGKNG